MSENLIDTTDIWDQITVVTITHNTGLVIGNFLDNLSDKAKLIIVDNASTDDTLEIVATKRPNATLIKNDIGVGYGNGCNCALPHIKTPFVVFANPDSICEDDVLEKLYESAIRYPKGGLFGPTTLTPEGAVEFSHDVEIWKRRIVAPHSGGEVPVGDMCAEFVTGVVALVRMEALLEIGGFDKEFFLYYEDDDMCLNMRRHGWHLMLIPNARVTHIGGGSVRVNRYYYWEKFWNIAWSRLYLEKKYIGHTAMIKLGLKNICRFTLKALGYCLILKTHKAWCALAQAAGGLSALIGIRASKVS